MAREQETEERLPINGVLPLPAEVLRANWCIRYNASAHKFLFIGAIVVLSANARRAATRKIKEYPLPGDAL